MFKAIRNRGSVCLQSRIAQHLPQSLHNHHHILSAYRFQSTVVDEQAEIARKSENQTVLDPPLNSEQRKVVDLILSGRNVFYTGAAGTGKSTVLRAVVRELQLADKTICVAAPTGRAALAIGGMTTWSFAGWSPSAHGHPLKELRRWARHRERLSKTDTLIIDEISMVENHHLERLNHVMKEAKAHAARKMGWAAMRKISQEAFGGYQVVVSGDFCQLPPVCPFSNCIECGAELIREPSPSLGEPVVYRCPYGHGPWPDSHKWAFQSQAWREAKFAHIELREVHRQAKDPHFIQILGRMRQGELTYDDIDTLTDPNRPTEDMTAAVRLYPTREEVRRYNSDQFKRLASEPYSYVALDSFHWNEAAHPELRHKGDRCEDGSLVALREHKFEPHFQLKKGMPVVLLVNLSINDGLVNGSQGRIVAFQHASRKDICPLPAESDGDIMASYVRNVRKRELMEFVDCLTTTLFPVVEFFNGQRRVIIPDCATYQMGNELEKYFDKEQYDPILTRFTYRPRPSLLCRTQIPLAPGWAMSVHKAQGMTLERVVVDLGRAFEDGQVYVAISRARQLAGLKVEGDPRGLLVGRDGNREVIQYYRQHFGKEAGTPTTLTGQSHG
ncbi:hypothetical protein DL769_006298 [Monosporascus sp. CRB-8-3]|nr:hypothetical protein DL769_006298 [Monosporascus sp. CRB-8-3]